MSNFQKKYYYDFKNNQTNQTNTVEIWQDIVSGISSTKVIGAVDPFIVTLPSLENKFQPVRGTGADLNLFATSSLQYMDLYTAAIQEYQVRHYIAGSLNWTGYLDTEIFSSDFSRQKNYNVAITANDGFALLDRMTYLQSNGTKFTGMSSHWSVITFILQKLNLPITYLYVALSTSVSAITNAASETTFHNTYAINSNFYNEDGEALTLREVLEGILKPYGAFIQQSGGSMYITDVNLIAGADTVMKVYNGTTFAYSSSTTLSKNIGDLSILKFMSADQTLNIVPALNKQVVMYSPYIQEKIIELDCVDELYNPAGATSNFGTHPYDWTETGYFNAKNWTRSNNGSFRSYVGANSDATEYYNADKKDSYFSMTGYTTNSAVPANLSFTYNSTLPNIIPAQSSIKITGKAYCRQSPDLDNPNYNPEWFDYVSQLTIRFRLKIGDKQVVSTKYNVCSWIDANSTDYSQSLQWFVYDNNARISDKWLDIKSYNKNADLLIPLDSGFSGGQMTFEIYDWDVDIKSSSGQAASHDRIKASVYDVRIKDLAITIVDSKGKEFPTDDTEYVGYMNAQYKNEGSSIDLIQGTNVTGSPVERASMLKANGASYTPISTWVRGGTTDNIENLLLRSYIGNYENKSIELNVKSKLLPTNIGYLTYNSYLSGKKLMPTSLKNDYANNTSEITMQEIFADSLTINKSF